MHRSAARWAADDIMDIEELTGFAKRAGFFWPAADIYGGVSGIFDYGHNGAMVKRRFEQLWLSYFVLKNQDYHLIDGSTILPEKPLVASGHAERFNDIIVGCSRCKSYFRADVMLSDMGIEVHDGATAEEISGIIKEKGVRCPKCSGELMEPKAFNMMIDVSLGPERADKGYLRPETAQSAYMNFFREFSITRKRLPMGLALIGRAYRNEISPRQGLFRLRELTQAELQIFFDPEKFDGECGKLEGRKMLVALYPSTNETEISSEELVAKGIPKFYVRHMELIDRFYHEILGIPRGRFRFFEKGGNDKAFYNRVHMDLEVMVESWGGFKEVGGLHYRGDYDLTAHTKGSSQDLSVSVEGRRFMPNVLELSFGVDRNIWMLVDVFLRKDGDRSVLLLPSGLAPYDAAVFPLQGSGELEAKAKEISSALGSRFRIFFDRSGSIGKRYARMDEIGTPMCITIDFDTIDGKSDKQGTVTVRARDDRSQERVEIGKLEDYILGKRSFA